MKYRKRERGREREGTKPQHPQLASQSSIFNKNRCFSTIPNFKCVYTYCVSTINISYRIAMVVF